MKKMYRSFFYGDSDYQHKFQNGSIKNLGPELKNYMDNLTVLIIVIIITILVILVEKRLRKSECKHTQQSYYDASGDELPGDQTEACFSQCIKCGKKFVIPSGFQSDAHFEHFLSESEQTDLTQKKRIS